VNRKKVASTASPKLYRSIREVSAELEVKPHVLRYWETQFPSLRPKKNRAGNRMYRPEEVMLLTRIKELLYAQRFTIEGARRLLTDEKKPRVTSKAAVAASAPVVAAAAAVPAPAPVAAPAPLAPSSDAEKKRLEKALAAAQAELAKTRTSLATKEESLATAKAALAASQVSLTKSKDSLAVADDRDKTRMAAMAVLRQELLLLARELRGEDENSAPAVAVAPEPALASVEPRVSIKASEPVETAETTEPVETGEPAPVMEQEPESLPVGVIAASVGA
jgi:DNA-binding transcriptional MerR regulator